MTYLCHIAILCAIYALLVVSLDLLAGHTGLLSMAHAAFYGLGAYTSALLVTYYGIPFVAAVAAGMLVAGAVSVLVSLPSLRLHDDYFVIATFGFQMIVFSLLNNWMTVTRGPLGIPAIPKPHILGWHVDTPAEFLVLSASFAVVGYTTVHLITTSPFGRVLHAIREDDTLARSFGKSTLCLKITAFAISAAMAAVSGSLYAHYITYIDPSSFTVMESILVISMVIIGGSGHPYGPLAGAVMLVTLPELLRLIGMPNGVAADLRQVLYGAALVLCMLRRPQGLVGEHDFGAKQK